MCKRKNTSKYGNYLLKMTKGPFKDVSIYLSAISNAF